MPTLAVKNPAPTVVSDNVNLPPRLPELPADVLKRFPSLAGWQEDAEAFWTRTYNAIQDSNQSVSQAVTKGNQVSGDLRISINGATASITVERNARITADEILAQRIVTVSAIAGVAQNIKVQGAPPGGPILNDYWVNNSDPLTPVTYQWDGVGWLEVTTPITVAAVAAEQTARITADGFLSAKYTLTVIAGNVVTGMNITSSTGTGTNISSVIFRATDFQIYNGASGIVMFSVSGANVNLAGVLTVSTSGKVFTGTGTYGNNNTPFYVDSSSNFSLGAALTWNGTTLTIIGSITATTGTIGGFDIGADYVRDAANSMGLASTVTGGDDVRFWAGDTFANRATAPFHVYESGALFSSSGTIGGFTIGATKFSATNIELNSAGSYISIGSGGYDVSLINAAGVGELVVNYSGSKVIELGQAGGGTFLSLAAITGASATVYLGGTALRVLFAAQTVANFFGTLAFTSADGVAGDTTLYRSAASTLKTDGALVVVGNVGAATFNTYGITGGGSKLLSVGTIINGVLVQGRYLAVKDDAGNAVNVLCQ